MFTIICDKNGMQWNIFLQYYISNYLVLYCERYPKDFVIGTLFQDIHIVSDFFPQ